MTLTELRKYLIETAVRRYNEQFLTNHKPEEFDIVTIQHKRYKYAFEIFTIRDDDSLRLRMYLEPSVSTQVGLYRILEHANGWTGNGDEVYVTYGTIGSDAFTFRNNLVRRVIDFSPKSIDSLFILLMEDDQPFILEQGNSEYLHMEEATAGGLYPN